MIYSAYLLVVPRANRYIEKKSIFHVMIRGSARRDVFRDQEDREKFLELLSSASERFDSVFHAYCLMGNHYHLLVLDKHCKLSPMF